ncbi:MAG: N-acetyl-D-Glu racemase DgcA [Pseudomonadota bacterium]
MELSARHLSWPLAGTFAISRGAKTTAEVVVAEIRFDGALGRAECTPYPRYDETVESVIGELERAGKALAGQGPEAAHTMTASLLPAGAARNALDCALWDLRSKLSGQSVASLVGEPSPGPVQSVYTLSLDTPEAMGEAARARAHLPRMKLKLAGDGDLDRVAAVRENAPSSTLIVDANEGWSVAQVEPFSAELGALGVDMIEQPLPAADDALLAEVEHPVPLCADESCHTRSDLARLAGRYEFVNIKLDKAGGLTEALALRDAARADGFKIMVGCMLASSLAMAPAVLVAQGAEVVDLDGPLWLARDWPDAMRYDVTLAYPAAPALWG